MGEGGVLVSYDVDIGSRSFNYTSNVGKLFYDHIPVDENGESGLRALDGLTGKQAGLVLSAAFDRIQATRHILWRIDDVGETEFRARYDAPNGWGSAIGGLLFIAQIMAACFENPRAKVRVDA